MKNYIFFFGLVFLLSSAVLANSDSSSDYSFSHEVMRADGTKILLEEAKIMLVSLWLAQEKDFGLKPVAAIWGIGGPALMLSPLYADKSIITSPSFAIPAGLGLVGLSYYNFMDAPDQEKEEVFITNFIGQNLILGICFLTSWILDEQQVEESTSNASIYIGFNSVQLTYKF